MPRHCLNRFIPLLLAFTLGGPVCAAHVDPAPLAAEVAGRVLHDLQAGQSDPLPEALGRHMDEAGALLRQTEQAEGAPQADLSAALRTQFAAKRQEVGVLRGEARARFAATRARLVVLGLSGQVAAWDALLKQVENRFDRLDRALASVQDSRASHERAMALAQTKAELKALHEQVKDREESLGGEPLPTFRTGIPAAPQPQPAADSVPEYLSYKDGPGSNQYAFLGNILLAAGPSPVPGEASGCSYTAADLAPALEVQLTPEIQALAEKLGYSPVRIYQYVANEIAFEPYYGSLKGAMGTLYSKAGGPTDQASLLIALLRASNIPARYVKGSIQINDASPLAQDGRGPRWLGAKSYAAAASILAQGMNPAAGTVTNAASQKIGIALAHVWVEACVPYGNYRGTGVDKTGFRWIPLDPSFKDKTYQAGIATNVGFDYAGYLATRSNQLPQEKYAQQVEAALKGVAPNYANNTLQDAGYTGKAVPRAVDILPATLPYLVTSFTAWPGSTSAEAAALPDAHRYQFTVTVNNGAGAALAPALTLPLPQVALNRITLSFKGATASDQTVLDAWKANPDMAAALPCTANVVPVIKVEGVDRTVGATGVGLCTKDNQLALAITLPELAAPSVNAVTYKNIGAANHHALQGYAFQASNRLLAERAAGLLATVKTTADPNSNPDGIEGEFLHIAGLKYMRYLTDAGKQIGMLDGGSGQSGNHIGLTSTQMKVQYLFDLPYAVYRQGLLVDVPGGVLNNVDLTSGNPVWKTFLLSGYAASAYEAYIWQENARLDAVSTVRGLQYARETGIEVLTLTSANWAAESPKLTSNANVALNYSASHAASIKTAYIDQGYTLTIPRSLIQYQDWKGAVFVGEKNTIAVDGQARATYAINQYAGGYTTGAVQPSLLNPVIDSGYFLSQASLGSLSTLPATLSSGVGLGNSPYNTTAGDPVHMVTGNLYHTERDIGIKGRGGLPIVFERSYNSRAAADGPLGYGWTHSFNHSFTFSDDNANGVTDPADSDGITSSV
ncbi:MAG: DUF6531 domain-containing protein, partial [Pseudomonadota bacterium]